MNPQEKYISDKEIKHEKSREKLLAEVFWLSRYETKQLSNEQDCNKTTIALAKLFGKIPKMLALNKKANFPLTLDRQMAQLEQMYG